MRLVITRFCVLLGLLLPLLGSAATPMVAAGGARTVALQADGTLWAWGSNQYGQLGDGTTTSRTSPVAIPGLTGVVAVAAGFYHSVALKADGTLWAWGSNYDGQLGDGTTTFRTSPVAVPGLTGVVAVTAVGYHSVALKADGTVWAWGWNVYGQLGDGTTTSRTSPVAVPGLTGVVAVAAGFYHSVALKADGTLWAWGSNYDGQLGDGTTTDRASPVAVPGLTGVVAVAAGFYHSVALKTDGTLWAWGFNRSGQLGDGTTTSRSSPVAVPGFNGVVAVTAGGVHTLALNADGTLLAWGHNSDGQLGDGTTTQRNSPVAVPGLTGVVTVAAGYYHSVALKADGTLWAWGFNDYGQLGDSTTTSSTSPAAVPGLNLVAGMVMTSLSVSTAGNGSGTARSSPAGIDCGATCNASYLSGTRVNLTATPAPGSLFSGWSGACSGTGACTVNLTQDQSVTATFALGSARLVNISTRGQVQTGDNLTIGGFIISGSTPKKILIRAVGPNLANHGVSGVLLDPTLQLYSGPSVIASNDNWGTASNAADITATGLAPVHALESAILTTLSPGAYTAIVSGVGGGTGVGIVEIFEVDQSEYPLINLSTRGQVQTGDKVMIGGFIIQGDVAKTVLIRAVGPNLLNHNVTGVLANPKLQLYSGQTVIASNDDWETSTNAADITATGLAPVNPLESAILITLQPGAYTAIVSGADGDSGVGIVEVFAQ